MARGAPTAPRHRGRGGGRRRRWAAALGLLAIVGGTAAGVRLATAEAGLDVAVDPAHQPASAPEALRGDVGAGRTKAAPSSQRVAATPVSPVRLGIPRLGVDVPVVPVAMETTTLVPPDDPQVLGWWLDGAKPGARRGTSVITGHTVHTGGGALDHLEAVRRGDRITVHGDGRSVAMRVTRVAILDKDQLSKHAQRLFSPHGPGRLALVTCEDWNGTTYDSNVVVLARPTRG